MFEVRNLRTFRVIFFISAILYLFSPGRVSYAFEQVDQSNFPEWGGGWTHINPDPNGQATMWQTFTPEQSNITAVEIGIFTINPGRGDDTLTVEIAKDGEILVSVERYVEDGFEGLLRFEFAQVVSVVPGELHELKVHDTGLTRFGWRYAANTYDAGSRYVSANERPGTDWFFQTYAAAEPRIIYVDDDAVGANHGTSWENAYSYLQDALAYANSAEKPVEIRVAQGIYKPDHGAYQTPGDREATFQLINGVTLKGGYAGLGEPDPNVREVELYETILSGDLNGDDVQIDIVEVDDPWNLLDEPTRGENSYNVVTGSGTDDSAILDGFTITAGNTDPALGRLSPPTGPDDDRWRFTSGAGMFNIFGSPIVANCKFTGNVAGYFGGGMFNYDCSMTLTNCKFNENYSAARGGGMYNEKCSLILTNCTFNENRAGGNGGGICNDWWSTLILTGCTFIRNSSDMNGGGMMGGATTLTNCAFIANEAQAAGGMWSDLSTLTNCTFITNKAGYWGGGMWSGLDNVSNCTFSGNSARISGGAIFIFCSELNLTNCTLTDNSAPKGNALASDEFHGDASNVEITNCIFWGSDNEIWNDTGLSTSIAISYSDIQGGQTDIYDPCEAVIWGEGNIDVDPDFVREGYWTEPSPRSPDSPVWIEGDYHLKSETGRWDPVSESWVMDNVTSPCIDAGDPNSPVGDEPDPNGGRINMGAYGGTTEASKSPAFSWFFETTQGPVLAKGLGIVLPHEHIFTDLRGPTTPGYGQADDTDVVRVMAPLLADAREKGVGVLIECSSIGVGRNAPIIAQVAETSGLPVVVPTGVYGRANFAPPEHQNMTEDELTTLFISEIRDGIDGTSIKAGFIKISTDEDPMNALVERILRAAGRAASETGAAIASHTPTGSNAVRQVDILEAIDPAIRFIWVHAQNESNRNIHVQLAARGAYIEFDSLGWSPGQDSTYIAAIQNLLTAGYGDRILLSHDAGWYQPGSANGGTQKPFTYLIDTFIPKLRDVGVDDATIRMITQTNPVRAFGFKTDN